MLEKPHPLIRRAVAADAALLAELGARTFSETFDADNKPEDMAAYLASAFGVEKQSAELADAHSKFFIAEVEGAAAGYAQLRDGDAPHAVTGRRPTELVRLYVSKEWLGRGVGGELMRACIDEARESGHSTLWLGVWEHNGRARAFYRKWDFRDVGEHDFVLGEDRQTDILMERQI